MLNQGPWEKEKQNNFVHNFYISLPGGLAQKYLCLVNRQAKKALQFRPRETRDTPTLGAPATPQCSMVFTQRDTCLYHHGYGENQ